MARCSSVVAIGFALLLAASPCYYPIGPRLIGHFTAGLSVGGCALAVGAPSLPPSAGSREMLLIASARPRRGCRCAREGSVAQGRCWRRKSLPRKAGSPAPGG